MKIYLTVKANAKKNTVEKLDKHNYRVYVSSPAEKGKANKYVLKILAKYFNVSPSRVIMVAGFSASNKIVEIY